MEADDAPGKMGDPIVTASAPSGRKSESELRMALKEDLSMGISDDDVTGRGRRTSQRDAEKKKERESCLH